MGKRSFFLSYKKKKKVEDLLDVHPLSFELVCDLGALLHHGDYIQTTLTDLDNLMRMENQVSNITYLAVSPAFKA